MRLHRLKLVDQPGLLLASLVPLTNCMFPRENAPIQDGAGHYQSIITPTHAHMNPDANQYYPIYQPVYRVYTEHPGYDYSNSLAEFDPSHHNFIPITTLPIAYQPVFNPPVFGSFAPELDHHSQASTHDGTSIAPTTSSKDEIAENYASSNGIAASPSTPGTSFDQMLKEKMLKAEPFVPASPIYPARTQGGVSQRKNPEGVEPYMLEGPDVASKKQGPISDKHLVDVPEKHETSGSEASEKEPVTKTSPTSSVASQVHKSLTNMHNKGQSSKTEVEASSTSTPAPSSDEDLQQVRNFLVKTLKLDFNQSQSPKAPENLGLLKEVNQEEDRAQLKTMGVPEDLDIQEPVSNQKNGVPEKHNEEGQGPDLIHSASASEPADSQDSHSASASTPEKPSSAREPTENSASINDEGNSRSNSMTFPDPPGIKMRERKQKTKLQNQYEQRMAASNDVYRSIIRGPRNSNQELTHVNLIENPLVEMKPYDLTHMPHEGYWYPSISAGSSYDTYPNSRAFLIKPPGENSARTKSHHPQVSMKEKVKFVSTNPGLDAGSENRKSFPYIQNLSLEKVDGEGSQLITHDGSFQEKLPQVKTSIDRVDNFDSSNSQSESSKKKKQLRSSPKSWSANFNEDFPKISINVTPNNKEAGNSETKIQRGSKSLIHANDDAVSSESDGNVLRPGSSSSDEFLARTKSSEVINSMITTKQKKGKGKKIKPKTKLTQQSEFPTMNFLDQKDEKAVEKTKILFFGKPQSSVLTSEESKISTPFIKKSPRLKGVSVGDRPTSNLTPVINSFKNKEDDSMKGKQAISEAWKSQATTAVSGTTVDTTQKSNTLLRSEKKLTTVIPTKVGGSEKIEKLIENSNSAPDSVKSHPQVKQSNVDKPISSVPLNTKPPLVSKDAPVAQITDLNGFNGIRNKVFELPKDQLDNIKEKVDQKATSKKPTTLLEPSSLKSTQSTPPIISEQNTSPAKTQISKPSKLDSDLNTYVERPGMHDSNPSSSLKKTEIIEEGETSKLKKVNNNLLREKEKVENLTFNDEAGISLQEAFGARKEDQTSTKNSKKQKGKKRLRSIPSEAWLQTALKSHDESSILKLIQDGVDLDLGLNLGAILRWTVRRENCELRPLPLEAYTNLAKSWGEDKVEFQRAEKSVMNAIGGYEGVKRVYAFRNQVLRQTIALKWHLLLHDASEAGHNLSATVVKFWEDLYGLSLDATRVKTILPYLPISELKHVVVKKLQVGEEVLGERIEKRVMDLRWFLHLRSNPHSWWERYDLEEASKHQGVDVLTVLKVGEALQFGSDLLLDRGLGRMKPDEAYAQLLTIMTDTNRLVPWKDSAERAWLKKLPDEMYQKRLEQLSDLISRSGNESVKINLRSADVISTVVNQVQRKRVCYKMGFELLWVDQGLPLSDLAKNMISGKAPFNNPTLTPMSSHTYSTWMMAIDILHTSAQYLWQSLLKS